LLGTWFAETISSTLKMEAISSSETSVETQNGLHGVISQKMIILKTTAVKTSNPTVRDLLNSRLHRENHIGVIWRMA
jgi:hypothetical protein